MTGVPLPIPRSEIAAALNEKIYIIGDFDEGHSTCEVYNPMTNKWTNTAPLPQLLDHTAATVSGGELYVVGGSSLIEMIYQTNYSSTIPLLTNG